MATELTGWLTKLEKRKRRRKPTYNIMLHILGAVNDKGMTLTQVASDLQVDADTLGRNMLKMGYEYRKAGHFARVGLAGPEG